MNHGAQSVIAIVLCAGMAPLISSAASRPAHSTTERAAGIKNDHTVFASEEKVEEEKWERDPMVFCARDRIAIRSYYRGRASSLVLSSATGGAATRPHLRRNGILAPASKNAMKPLADDLEVRLHFLYFGYSRGMIGKDVVIVEDGSQRIIDIIRDVTAGR
jgi:hypothetical protein